MAGKDNILEAPAQGFGQTVSFTTSPDSRRTPMLDGVGRSGVSRGGVQGSPVSGNVQRMNMVEAPPPDPTMQLLQKVAGVALQARIKEEKAAAFVTGMQRAAAGEAVKDIAEGEPWYARIFGDSDVVEGARAYTAQARAAETAAALEDSMPEVRKLGPEEANSYFAQLVKKQMTGDDATDAALMQGFARTLPATMRRQAKEHYAWKQEQASAAESSALLSAADLLQKRAALPGPQMQTDEEYAAEAVKLVAGMRPAVGRDVESWTKARTSDLLALAQSGKFHAVNAIREAGMLQLLTPEQRTKVESALDTAENRTLATKSFEYAEEIGRIAGQAEVYSTDLSPAGTMAQLQELNARFRKETGIDRDLISLDKGTGIIKDVHTTLLREGERRVREAEAEAAKAAAAGDKARAETIKQQAALGAIGMGQAGAVSRADGMNGIVSDVFLKAYESAGQQPQGVQKQAQLLMQNFSGNGSGDGYVSKDIKDQFERLVDVSIGSSMPDSFLALHEKYAALKAQNPALADAYFGKHAERMAIFDSLLQPGNVGSRGEAQAFVTAFGSQQAPSFKPLGSGKKDNERAAFAQAIAGSHDSPWWKVFGTQRVPLREDQLEVATRELERAGAMFRSLPGVNIDQAAQRAFSLAKQQRGDDMLGGFYVRGNTGQLPLTDALRTHRPGDSAKGTGDDAADVWDTALLGVLRGKAEKTGIDLDDPVQLIRQRDTTLKAANGKTYTVANLTAIMFKDGVPVAVNFTSDDIKAYARDPKLRTRGGPVTQ
jgi:hypothetical protein